MTMKASESARSHSWWWNSHISPRNSKWLRESLTDMDSKISAMLKIIEEDADSFAQRAEMYYKKRPELVILVEEFYRAYRALAERYHSVTGELRQSFRARYAQSNSDSSPKSHDGLHQKKGLPVFDPLMVSLSQSLTGGFDYDEDLESEISSKELKMPFDDGGPFSAYIKAENEDNTGNLFSKLMQEKRTTNNLTKINSLQQEIHQLVEEKKQLRLEMAAHATLTEKYELQFSELQEQIKNLEAEGEHIREKLQAAINQEHILEDENSKLKQLYLALEEERTEAAMLCERSREDCKLASKKLKDLEEELLHVRRVTTEEASIRIEKIMRLEEQEQKLQNALLAAQQENKERETYLQSCLQKIQVVEKELKDLQDRISNLQAENFKLKDELAIKILHIEKLQQQLLECQHLRKDLEDKMHAKDEAEEELKENLRLALEQVKKLENEMQHLEQSLHDLKMVEHKLIGLEEEILQLQEENKELESTRVDGIMRTTELEKELQVCEQERQILHSVMTSSMQQFRKQQEELSILKNQKETLDDELAVSTTQFKKAKEEILKLQESKHMLEKQLSMQLNMVAKLQEDYCILNEENNELAKKLELKSEQFQELEENMLKLQQILTNQEGVNRDLIDKPSTTLERYNALLKDFKKLGTYISQLQEENQQIKTEASIKLTDLDNLRREISQVSKENHAVHAEMTLKVQHVAMLEEESSNQKKEKYELEKELQARLGKIQILEEKLVILECMVTNLQEENRTLADKSFRAEKNYKELQQKLNRANEEIQLLRNENTQRQMEVEDQIEVVGKLEKEQSRIQEERKVLEDEIMSNVKIIENLHKNAKELQQEEKRLNWVIHNQVEKLQQQDEQIQRFCGKASQVEEENEHLRILLSKSKDEGIFLGNRVTQLEQELTCLKAEKSHYENQTYKQMERKKDVNKEICRLQMEKNVLLEEVASIAKEQEISQQKVCTLQEQLKALEASFLAKEQDIKTLELESQKLVHTLILNSEAHHFREQQQDEQIQLFCGKASHVEEENEHLLILLSKSKDEGIFLGNRATQLEQELTCLKAENGHYENKTNKQIERGKELNEEICRLQTEKHVLLEEVASIKKQLEISQQEVCALQEQLKVLEASFLAREQEIKTLELDSQKLVHTLILNSEAHNFREEEWKEKIHQLKAELASTWAQVRQLEEEDNMSQEGKRMADNLLVSRDANIKLLQEELLFLHEKLNTTRSFYSINQKAQEQTMGVANEMQKMIEDYEREISELKHQILELQDQNSRLEAEASDEVGMLECFYSKEDMINAYDLHQELQQLREERESLQAQLENKLEEVENMEVEMTKQQQILLSMQQEIKGLRDEYQVIYSMQHEEDRGLEYDHHLVEFTSFSTDKDVSPDYTMHHVNLGNRLHQEVVDDKMQLQIIKLQEVQRKMRFRLQEWTENIDNLQDKLEKIQNLVISSSDENDYHKEAIKDLQREATKHNRVSNSLRELEERKLLLQKKKDELGLEVKLDAKATMKIKKELMSLFEQEKGSSFEAWEVQACKLQDQIDGLQEKNEKHLDVFHEMDEQVKKIQVETQTVYHQAELLKEDHISSLHDFKPFSVKHYSEQALFWLSTDRRRKTARRLPKKEVGAPKQASEAKKTCRCCVCMDPKAVAE